MRCSSREFYTMRDTDTPMTTKQRAVTAARIYLTYGAAPFDVILEWNDDRIPADLIFDGDRFTAIAERQCLEDVRRHSPDLDNELIAVRKNFALWSFQEQIEEMQWFWGLF